MRADRLLSMVMLLQARGRLTARELAKELQVTERTIYRDLVALSAAGIPVYTDRGPGGGIALVEEYRTTLTGLTPEETRALFMVSIPEPLMQLGVGEQLKTAMRKLSASLPDSRRSEEERARLRIHLDSSWWFQSNETLPCLPVLQQAVWQDRKVRIRYRSNFETLIEKVVAPYGLVAKANLWHLVYGLEDTLRVLRVGVMEEAELLNSIFYRQPGFDLALFWREWCRGYESERPIFPVKVRVSPGLFSNLPQALRGTPIGYLEEPSSPDISGWVTLALSFESFFAARAWVLGFGNAVQVLEPEALRKSVIDFAEQIVHFYFSGNKEPE